MPSPPIGSTSKVTRGLLRVLNQVARNREAKRAAARAAARAAVKKIHPTMPHFQMSRAASAPAKKGAAAQIATAAKGLTEKTKAAASFATKAVPKKVSAEGSATRSGKTGSGWGSKLTLGAMLAAVAGKPMSDAANAPLDEPVSVLTKKTPASKPAVPELVPTDKFNEGLLLSALGGGTAAGLGSHIYGRLSGKQDLKRDLLLGALGSVATAGTYGALKK